MPGWVGCVLKFSGEETTTNTGPGLVGDGGKTTDLSSVPICDPQYRPLMSVKSHLTWLGLMLPFLPRIMTVLYLTQSLWPFKEPRTT